MDCFVEGVFPTIAKAAGANVTTKIYLRAFQGKNIKFNNTNEPFLVINKILSDGDLIAQR